MMAYQKVNDDLLIKISEIIPNKNRILTEKSDLASYAFDASFGLHFPEVVIQPSSTDEVADIVTLANHHMVPVYPRGHSTSLSGGPLPVEGGIVLDLSKMTSILEIRKKDLLAVVSPGVLTASIHQAAEEVGLMYPPDPSSSNVSTIGGNLAENSGGPRCLKYGVTKDYVLGLEVVTPEGHIMKTGGQTIKNVTGFDLTKLIIGSEGALGIITKANLQLIPKPLYTGTALIAFDDIVDAGEAVSEILTSGVQPSKLEIMDQACIQAVEDYHPSGLPTDADAIILLEVDGNKESIQGQLDQVEDICHRMGLSQIVTEQDPQEQDKLWQARKMVSPAITRIKPTKISEDATVPLSKIPDMFKKVREVREKYQLNLVIFGHAGDGNLHPNIVANKNDKEEMKRVEKAITEIFETAIALGGTLSGEHGIGTMKASFMPLELGEVELDMMKRIKKAWDPNNILNPGKIFPTPGQTFSLTE